VSFAAVTLCVASQRVFIVDVIYFVIDSVRKLLDTPHNNQPTNQPTNFFEMSLVTHLFKEEPLSSWKLKVYCRVHWGSPSDSVLS